jgi:hypothetical protein
LPTLGRCTSEREAAGILVAGKGAAARGRHRRRIEIHGEEGTTTKALWMQAKRTERRDPDAFTLKDFPEQFSKMEKRTDAAYGLY